MNHETIPVMHPSGEEVDIDKMLAPLITQLWRFNINTFECCEEWEPTPGFAVIFFCDVSDFQFLCRLVLTHEEDDVLSDHISMYGEQKGSWSTEIFVNEPDQFEVMWLFPHSDIPLLVERLENK